MDISKENDGFQISAFWKATIECVCKVPFSSLIYSPFSSLNLWHFTVV